VHPAPSIVLFTTASGAGYGLLFVLGLGAPLGLVPSARWLGFAGLGLALGLITLGLLASTFHLGHPERAWRAITQWRSSWLSREGLLAVITYIPAGLFAIGWVGFEHNGGIWGWFGISAAMLSAATVYATAMIYRSLKPIQRWCNAWVVPNYLLLGLMTGALWLAALVGLHARPSFLLAVLAIVATALAWAAKWRYWRFIDASRSVSTSGSATGLGHLGAVRLFEAPHTGENYLMREMGFRVARKHAMKLRHLVLLLAFALPLLLSALAGVIGGWGGATAALVAAISASAGVLVERWLFFAEAKHAVTLYYGAESA